MNIKTFKSVIFTFGKGCVNFKGHKLDKLQFFIQFNKPNYSIKYLKNEFR